MISDTNNSVVGGERKEGRKIFNRVCRGSASELLPPAEENKDNFKDLMAKYLTVIWFHSKR